MTLVAPSILSADFTRLGEEIRAVEIAGADLIHVDVMDGHFVPNISIGTPIVAAVRSITTLPIDCHLMISNPADYIAPFAKAGANWISVHVEACDLAHVLPAIRALGCKAGAVINPPTPLDRLLPSVELADYILVMSVNPGFAGQRCIPKCLEKVRALKRRFDEHKLTIPIQIDGGITPTNAGAARTAGASIIVAASAIFQSDDYGKAIAALRGESLS
ncbi:MAG: ribulose-phosphate 3-epimerase [Deltaproteobacteria bacterium]|nr:ribulose-phosphate 3-epimerase [Deltaproteobacteria bacterium]